MSKAMHKWEMRKFLRLPAIAPAFSRIFRPIIDFLRSIFKKKRAIPKVTFVPESEKPRETWRSPAETRSLLKQLRPGDQLFDKGGNPMAIYRIMNRRKTGILVEVENGSRWKLHFMGLQSRAFSPDLQ